MSDFDKLHPALQHHIVNSLGWRDLRPLQEQSIDPILAGAHCLLIAPTAGGKTEAAVFPLLSRMLDDGWTGLSILYVCPLRALLNNLSHRLAHYAGLVGRTCGVWHGDTPESARNRIRIEPPDILLTTPESIEAMLVSARTDHIRLLRDLRAVVVDEIHAFAGDDRGWHLLSVLERVASVAGRRLQRLGLSATIGNPEALLNWLTGECAGARVVLNPMRVGTAEFDVQLDYVGSLGNAATVVSRLHRGEKRLVFVDSRARVEELASSLRQQGVETCVSHSSLAAEERRRSENTFAEGRDCVIVATSALELGIDVGDLDRVVQVDAPNTVASFLQRLGRTGRRPGRRRNCLFLATSENSLLQGAALLRLWQEEFVEPVIPPPAPYAVFAQQLLALLLQQSQHGVHGWREGLSGFLSAWSPDAGECEAVVSHMLQDGILASDQGILWFGRRGEDLYGLRNFTEMTSVFTSPPLFCVRSGRREIGHVHASTFDDRAPRGVILLAGRAWQVTRVDWYKRVAYVEPTEDEEGRSRWLGVGPALSYELCQAMRRILASQEDGPHWSRRGRDAMRALREQHPGISREGIAIENAGGGKSRVWTFAGKTANQALALWVTHHLGVGAWAANLHVSVDAPVSRSALGQLPPISKAAILACMPEAAWADWAGRMKFHECLPGRIQEAMFVERQLSLEHAQVVIDRLRGHSGCPTCALGWQ